MVRYDGGPTSPSRRGAGARRARSPGSRRRATPSRRSHRRPHDRQDLLGQGLVRQPRVVQRLRQPAAPRPDLRPQRLGLHLELRPGTIRPSSAAASSTISVEITPLPKPRWRRWSGSARGRSARWWSSCREGSRGVMEVVTRRETGLFPSAKEIDMKCSCPDWAAMCKHVAAVLYGVGARLDTKPELFFRLARRSPGPAHGRQQRHDPGGAGRRNAQADRRDCGGRGLWDRT